MVDGKTHDGVLIRLVVSMEATVSSHEQSDPPLPEPSIGEDYSRRKRNCLAGIVAISIATGIGNGALGGDWDNTFEFVISIAITIGGIMWTYRDAAEHDFSLSPYFVWLIVLLPGPLVVMPVYFVKTRGWIGGAIASFITVAFLVGSGLIHGFVAVTVYDLIW